MTSARKLRSLARLYFGHLADGCDDMTVTVHPGEQFPVTAICNKTCISSFAKDRRTARRTVLRYMAKYGRMAERGKIPPGRK